MCGIFIFEHFGYANACCICQIFIPLYIWGAYVFSFQVDIVEDFFFYIDRNAKLSEALGEVVRSTESFPIRKTTVEKVTEDILRTIPGNEKRKRDDFRRSDLTIKEQGAETPASAAPGKKNGAEKKDNK